MKVAFTYPPHRNPRNPVTPPAGLLAAATAVAADHVPAIVDGVLALRIGRIRRGLDVHGQFASQVLATSPDVVAISAQSCTLPASVSLSRRLREAGFEGPIVLGGYGVQGVAPRVLEILPPECFVVEGDAEPVMADLLRQLETGNATPLLPGVYAHRAPKPPRPQMADLRLEPFPEYGLVDVQAYADANRISLGDWQLPLDVGRGCSFPCSFCSYAALRGRRHLTRSPTAIREQIEELGHTYGLRRFAFTHDCFTLDRPWAEEVCDAIQDAGIRWTCKTRSDLVDDELLRRMAAVGCESILYGIEAADETTRQALRKHGLRDAEDIVCATADYRIWPVTTYMVGGPNETVESIDATVDLAVELAASAGALCSIQLPIAYPGTALWAQTHGQRERGVAPLLARGAELAAEGDQFVPEDASLIASHLDLFATFSTLRGAALPARELYALALGLRDATSFLPLTLQAWRQAGRSVRSLLLARPEDVDRLAGHLPDACSMQYSRPPLLVVDWLMDLARRVRAEGPGLAAELAAFEATLLLLRVSRDTPRVALLGPFDAAIELIAQRWTDAAVRQQRHRWLAIVRTGEAPRVHPLSDRAGVAAKACGTPWTDGPPGSMGTLLPETLSEVFTGSGHERASRDHPPS